MEWFYCFPLCFHIVTLNRLGRERDDDDDDKENLDKTGERERDYGDASDDRGV